LNVYFGGIRWLLWFSMSITLQCCKVLYCTHKMQIVLYYSKWRSTEAQNCQWIFQWHFGTIWNTITCL
jgi:hypothetical protein